MAEGKFEAELLPAAFEWFRTRVLPCVQTVLGVAANEADDASRRAVVRLRERLRFFVYESFATLRITELFDILKCFPERYVMTWCCVYIH